QNNTITFKYKKQFKADLSTYSFPNDTALYKKIFHNPPICQGNTGTCWSYSATSFFESEIYRISGKKVKLSEMYAVYWEYVERAIDFVNTRGKTYVDEGSEASALLRIYQKYGAVPYSAYIGKPNYRIHHSHREMVKEIKNFLSQVKENNIWNEEYVVNVVKSLLNAEMGAPPTSFSYEGKEYTPKSFLNDYMQIKPTAYFRFMSTMSAPFYEKSELVENDNWWHDREYYNVPADTFVKLINKALEKNYSVCLCGDVSEAGYDHNEQKVAVVPVFDIPSSQINESSREMRLQNETTTDDHCIHVIGYYQKDGKYWYLIKDSNGNTFDGTNPGYRIYSEDYVKLKMMNIMINGEAGRWFLDKFVK
ncbi:MAG: C1 family peptidase, partial [Bacteroidales bacterium]